MKVGNKQINGVDTEVHADHNGTFSIQIDGKSIGNGTTLEAAITMARNSINREKTVVNVEFITITGGEHGVATGFHSRNRTVMAKIEGGKGEQLDYNYRALKPDIPKAKLDRWFEIKTTMEALRGEQRILENEYVISLRDEVQQAITDAQSKTLAGVTARAAARRSGVNRKRRY